MSLIGRSFDESDIHPQRSACAGSDVVMNTSVLSIFPFDVECKKGNSTTLEQAYVQSAKRCPDHLRPLVILEPDRKKAVVFGKEDDLFSSADDDLFVAYGNEETFNLVKRKRRNKTSLYDLWYPMYKKHEGAALFTTNPLCEPDKDPEELSTFVQMEFNFWVKLWCEKLVE